MIYIVVKRGKKRRDFKAYGQQVTIGRDLACEVALPDAEELEPRHLLCVPGGDGVWVAVVEGARVSARVGDRLFTRGVLPIGTTVEIGELHFSLHDRQPPRPNQTKALAILAGVAFPVIIAARLFGSPHTHKKSHEPEPVALFEEPARCTGPAATLAAAQELAEGAAAKKDRFPFSVIDGIQAVQIFGSAEACFSAAGADDRAAAARAARLALKTRIEDDYRILRARLAWALEQGRMETAMESTQLLLVYVSHRDGPYRQWLLGMAAQLKPRAEQERAKAKKEQEAKDKKRRRM